MSERFELIETSLAGLTVLQRHVVGDHRGFLQRLYCAEELRPVLGERRIAQVNHTMTANRGTVRGMHYQRPPHAETKVVSCLRGEVFDVAVDLRRGSPTFLQWHGEVLSAANRRALAIPEGFAHGFQTLTDDCELLYLHTAAYAPHAEAGVSPRDPKLGIRWPAEIVTLSARDDAHPPVTDDFAGVTP